MTHVPMLGTSRAITPDEAAHIAAGMSLNAVIEILGPARRDIGSAMIILEWAMIDGRNAGVIQLGRVQQGCSRGHRVSGSAARAMRER